ncbi:MAG: hypothetical protein KF862_17640 [Chitinophagaceae bacterium]|nr:hypothetical protein [Chitinophagaceae bacterium]
MRIANLAVMMLVWIQVAAAQQIRTPVSAPYLSSGAYSHRFPDVLNSTSHIASLAALNNFSAGILSERRFMLKETAMHTAVIGIPTASGNFVCKAHYFGYNAYNESEISLGYARKLNDRVDIGAAFNYYNIRISNYGSAGSVNFEIGSIFHITQQLHAGVQVYNPLQSRLGKNTGEKLAAVYKAGLGYEISESLLFTLEVIKQSNTATGVHLGLQYKPIKQLFARTGYITGNNILYAGAGYQYKQMRLDMTAGFHQRLGFSPGILLLYEYGKKKPE